MLPTKVLMFGPGLNQHGGIQTLENLICKNIPSPIRVRHVSTHEDASVLRRLFLFAQSITILIASLSLRKVDVVHIHMASWGSAVRKVIIILIASVFIPVIIHPNGSEYKMFHEQLPQFFRRLVGYAYKKCKYFVTVSNSWKEFYTSSYGLEPSRVVVLPNAVEVPGSIPDRSSRDRVKFVSLGRIGKRKGTFDLIMAYSSLPPDCKKHSELILAGDGDIGTAKRLVEGLTSQISISFTGWIEPEQRQELLREADVFVLPSYNEGLPLAMLEAMGFGLPVICTPVGGIAEVIFPWYNGLLVSPGKVQQLTQAMQTLIEDKELRLRLGAAGRKTVEPFEVKSYCSHLSAMYISATSDAPLNTSGWFAPQEEKKEKRRKNGRRSHPALAPNTVEA